MADAPKRRLSLPIRILIGLVVGLVAGIVAQKISSGGNVSWCTPERVDWIAMNIAAPIGKIFLNFLFLVIVPLLFSCLVLGVAGLGDLKGIGRLGTRLLVGTLVLTAAGIFIGILLVNVVRPGARVSPESRALLVAKTSANDVTRRLDDAKAAKPFAEVLPTFISRNPVEDIANMFTPNPNYKGGGVIAFMFFAIIIGAAIVATGRDKCQPLLDLMESVLAVSMRIIDFAMLLAPFGVAALIFQTAATVGLELFSVLGTYVIVVLGALLAQALITYSLVLKIAGRHKPTVFFKATREAMVTAFSTSSSNATLPTALRVAHENLKLNKSTSSFVLTVGATANQNGTALFEGITVLFLAQFYGVDLEFQQQIWVVLASMLAGVGTAGVPGGSIPLIAILLTQVGIPAQGIGIILGVDRVLDMSRTVINVLGDLVLAEVCDAAVPTIQDAAAYD